MQAKLKVIVDLNDDISAPEVERMIAIFLAEFLDSKGHPGNVTVRVVTLDPDARIAK